MKSRDNLSQIGLEGTLMVMAPLPFLFSWLGMSHVSWWDIRFLLAAASALQCFFCGLTLFRHPFYGKAFGIGSAATSYATVFQYILARPFAALASSICLVFIITNLLSFEPSTAKKQKDHLDRCMDRARWGAWTALGVAAIDMLSSPSTQFSGYCSSASLIISQSLFLHWAIAVKSPWRTGWCTLCTVTFGLLFALFPPQHVAILAYPITISLLLMMPRSPSDDFISGEQWWEFLINHPGRILFTTFFFLCLSGSLLLSIPAATTKGPIAFIDAAFTSVSAVCVTGLIVLDTPHDFSSFGQIIILALIQLGGLGIMSITTVGLHAMGRRLSLKHERLMASMADTSHLDLLKSLRLILRFTFAAECCGAVSLAAAFLWQGDSIGQAVWRGLFTAISAFCNAGFALQTDNLIPYQNSPAVLHIVALLIIFGGIAPSTSILVPKWLAGKPVPIGARLALITTIGLLFSGTFFILIFEWNGVLTGLSAIDKLQNAWFQSATLRTAGFNSVDITHIASPTFLIMALFMFIGGSPGGTAGGVKTTTVSILLMTFWANITNQSQIIIQKRRIHMDTLFRAVTVIAAGGGIWLLAVLMLIVTQDISARSLIFEATSALGTVGLSVGATPLLDEIGKVIIILAMFIGRIGPVSLFMLLIDDNPVPDNRYPLERISLT